MRGLKITFLFFFLLLPISGQALLVETSKGHRLTILQPHAAKSEEKNNSKDIPKGKVYVQPLIAGSHSPNKANLTKTKLLAKKAKSSLLPKNRGKNPSNKGNKL